MNKFILSTKQFFNKKPVRIVTALLIIAAIMTGISFGVIALVKALSDPCAKLPGTTWDKDLKVCVKDGCKNVCATDTGVHKPGDCLPDDYCEYSISGIEYKFDQDTCKCRGICSSDNEIAKTENGDDNTAMKKEGSGWEPVNPLRCGFECEFSDSGICLNKDTHCGISITKDGSLMPLSGPTLNCVSVKASDIEICPTDNNIVCANPQWKCSTTEENINVSRYEYSTNTYCYDISKCGMHDSSKEHICRIGSKDCGDTNDCKSHPVFLKKGIYKLGVCNNKYDISNTNKKCQNPINIGEYKFDPTASLWEEVAFVTESGMEGISLNQPQCKSRSSPQCKKRDDNAPWFCLTGDLTSCNYGKPPGTSCEEDPPVSSISEAEGNYSFKYTPNCCDKNKLSTLGDGSFCCPLNAVKVQKSGEDEYLCLNKSEYVSDSSWVELYQKTCNTSVDCQIAKNRKILYDKLKIGMPHPKLPQSSNKEDSTYSDLYCDSGNCKFFAGYVDKVITNTQKKDQNDVKYDALWLVGDDDNSSTSEAVYIGNDTGFVHPSVLPYNGKQNLNLCRTDSDINGRFGIYDLDGKQISQKKDHYFSELYVQKQPKGKKSVPVTTLECLNYAKNNLSDAYWRSHINDDGSSAQTGNIKKPGEDTCIFTADCGASNFETSAIDSKFLKWNFGPDDVRQLYNKEIRLNDANKTKVKFATYPKFAENNWMDACNNIAGGKQCDAPHIPSAWSKLEHNFVNICKTDPTNTNYCTYNSDAYDDAIYLINPTINGEQYCDKGVDFSQTKGKFECNN
jgi:hypothetical protein